MIKPRGRKNIPLTLMAFGRHLVYAEGTKTEPLYVEDLKLFVSEQLNVSKEDIEIVPVKTNKSQHTVELVQYAIKDVEKRLNNQETINYVWIFYDKDDYQDFDKAYKLIKKQNKVGSDIEWKACWSNECFEVWAYHYFENLESQIDRKLYIEKINDFLKKNGCKEKYDKTRKDIHHFLTNNGGDIRLATKHMKAKDTDSDSKPNPSSGIYQFAEYLLVYIDNEKAKTKRMN